MSSQRIFISGFKFAVGTAQETVSGEAVKSPVVPQAAQVLERFAAVAAHFHLGTGRRYK